MNDVPTLWRAAYGLFCIAVSVVILTLAAAGPALGSILASKRLIPHILGFDVAFHLVDCCDHLMPSDVCSRHRGSVAVPTKVNSPRSHPPVRCRLRPRPSSRSRSNIASRPGWPPR
jgi:hypothetical protein